MIGSPANTNSIYIPIVPTGCLKAEFDSTYPVHLNGIISQEEFQQSIRNINRAIVSYKTPLIIFSIIFMLAIIGGTTCIIVAGATATKLFSYKFYLLMAFGIVLTIIGSLVFSIGMCILHSKRTTKMRQAVAEESMKYSTRSPIACSWRLNIISNWNRGFGYRQNNQPTYNLVVDIGRFVSSENINPVYYSNHHASEPAALFGRQNNYAPPPYSAPSATQFCSRCGAARQDLTNKYCLSCEQAFNNY